MRDSAKLEVIFPENSVGQDHSGVLSEEWVIHEEVAIRGQPDTGNIEASCGGIPVPELCRERGMSTATFARWADK